MKKYLVIILLLVHAHIHSAVPAHTSMLKTLYKTIVSSQVITLCRKAGYVGAVCGAGYLFLRYLNDALRNSSRTASFKQIQNRLNSVPKIEFETDEIIQVQGTDDREPSYRTERIDPDKHDEAFKENKPAAPEPGNRLERLLRWLFRPTHRMFVRHILSVPRTYDLSLKARNAYNFDHPQEQAIEVRDMQGTIEAHAHSGNISITNPAGNVILETPDHVEITDFARQATVITCQSLHATRHEGNRQVLTIEGKAQPELLKYEWKQAAE